MLLSYEIEANITYNRYYCKERACYSILLKMVSKGIVQLVFCETSLS